jgi:hypothetical protein
MECTAFCHGLYHFVTLKTTGVFSGYWGLALKSKNNKPDQKSSQTQKISAKDLGSIHAKKNIHKLASFLVVLPKKLNHK